MRGGYEKRRTSVLTWLISAIVAVFLVQNVVARLPGMGVGLESTLGLSSLSLRAGHLWTLVTYGFLHDTGNLLQPVAFLLALYFTGRELLPLLGTRRFLGLYAAALVAGGLAFTALHWRQPELLLGASAAVYALIAVYACFFPNREISLLLFFVLPVTIRPKYLVCTLLVIDLCGLIFYELLGLSSPFAAAHSAHLAGMAAGWIYFRYFHDSNWSFAPGRRDIELPRWAKQRAAAKTPSPAAAFTVDLGDRGHLRAQLDRILDKINSDGFGSLSAGEKKILDDARDLISRR